MAPTGPFETLALTLRRRLLIAEWQRAFERWSRTRPPGSVELARFAGVGGEENPSEATQTARIWMAGLTRWRHEVDVPGRGVAVKVVDGRLWWSYAPGVHAMSNESSPVAHSTSPGESPGPELLDPQPLVDSLSVIDTRADTYLGRAVTVLRAAATGDPHPLLARGADRYELVLDRRSGIALRIAASLDGREFSSIEVTKVEFDVPLAPGLFRVELPPGMSFAPPSPPERRRGLVRRLVGKLRVSRRGDPS